MTDAGTRTPYCVDGIMYAAEFPVEFAHSHLEDTGPIDCANCAYFGCNDNNEFFGYCLNCIDFYHGERPSGADPKNNSQFCQDCYTKLSAGEQEHVCDNDGISESYFYEGGGIEEKDMDEKDIEEKETEATLQDSLFLNCEHGGSSNTYTPCFRSRCECVCHGCWFSRHPKFHCMHQYTQCDDPTRCECSCERCMTSDDRADYHQSLTEDF